MANERYPRGHRERPRSQHEVWETAKGDNTGAAVSAPLTLESDTSPQLIVQADTSGTQTAIDLRTAGLHVVATRWIYDSATSFINWLGALAINRIFGFHVNAPDDSLVISSAGNVGLGTATPAAKLEVVGAEARVAPTASNQNAVVSVKPTGTGVGAFRVTNAGGTQSWRIDENGGNLRVVDETGGLAPVRVEPGAPSHTLVVDSSGAVAVGTVAPSAAAALQADSTTKGFLPPRMTHAQMLAISSPPAGLTVFNTSAGTLWTFNGTWWLPTGGAQSKDLLDLRDDFLNSSMSSNLIGEVGWNISNGATGKRSGEINHPGILQRNANANMVLARTQLSGGSTTAQIVHSDNFYYMSFVAAPTLSAGTSGQSKWSVGLYNDQAALPNAGTNAIEFVLDGYGVGDTNWHARVDDGVTTTRVDTGVSVASTIGAWTHFEIVKTAASGIRFYINGTLVATVTTDLPSAMMYVGMKTIRNATATPGFDVDYWRVIGLVTR